MGASAASEVVGMMSEADAAPVRSGAHHGDPEGMSVRVRLGARVLEALHRQVPTADILGEPVAGDALA
jgi:hypothetical protein